ncbi:hypothetical protein LTR95_005276 [Oleoguttula sp. CCFEE 5521]
MADIYQSGTCLLAHVDVPECDFTLVVASVTAVRRKMKHELDEMSKIGYRLSPTGFGEAPLLMLGLSDDAILALWHFFHQLKHDLQSLVSLSNFYEVTDERDYVYALLALYQKATGISTLPPALTSDYTQEVSKVFLRACQYAMSESQNLDMWNMPCMFSADTKDQPSWAWQSRSRNLPATNPLVAAARTEGALGHEFTACGTSEALKSTIPKFSGEDGRVLSVQGVSPDTVHIATPPLLEKSDEALSTWLVQVIGLFLPFAQVRGTSMQSLGTTLVAAWQSTARKDGDSDGEDFVGLLSTAERASGVPLVARKRTHYDRAYYISLKLACVGRRFFITRGGFLGLGPGGLEVWDKVAMLAGGKWPFALRRCEGEEEEKYKLVGACYVHTVMDGKKADDYVEKGSSLKQFCVV